MKRDTEAAIVSIWETGVNRGEFLGSAFFISPKLVITARHVVEACVQGDTFGVGGIAGADNVRFSRRAISKHPQFDVAVVELGQPFGGQPVALVELREADHNGLAIGLGGYNTNPVAYRQDLAPRRDWQRGYTAGPYDPIRHCYCINHRVVKGFSGGAVACAGAALGVLIKRHGDDQKTL